MSYILKNGHNWYYAGLLGNGNPIWDLADNAQSFSNLKDANVNAKHLSEKSQIDVTVVKRQHVELTSYKKGIKV